MDKQQMARGIHTLAQKLKDEKGLSIGSIAQAGGLSRQAMYNSHAREDITTIRVTGFGLSVVAAAIQNGYVAEALSLLSGNEVQLTTVMVASMTCPDLTPEELKMLRDTEVTLNMRPLPGHLIKSLLLACRTPTT